MLAGPSLEAEVGAVLLLHPFSSVSKRYFFTWVPKEHHNLLKTPQGCLGFYFHAQISTGHQPSTLSVVFPISYIP